MQISNGPTEGANNLIKRVKRVAFGFRSFRNFRVRVPLRREARLGETRDGHTPRTSEAPVIRHELGTALDDVTSDDVVLRQTRYDGQIWVNSIVRRCQFENGVTYGRQSGPALAR